MENPFRFIIHEICFVKTFYHFHSKNFSSYFAIYFFGIQEENPIITINFKIT